MASHDSGLRLSSNSKSSAGLVAGLLANAKYGHGGRLDQHFDGTGVAEKGCRTG